MGDNSGSVWSSNAEVYSKLVKSVHASAYLQWYWMQDVVIAASRKDAKN